MTARTALANLILFGVSRAFQILTGARDGTFLLG
jgi:hypothetical protein